MTNKLLGRSVDRIAIAFDEAKKYFKYPDKCFMSGNPIRHEFVEFDKGKGIEENELDKNLKTIVCFGGSGGQRSVNDAMIDAIKSFNSEYIQLIHITGKVHYEKFMDKLKENEIELSKNIRILPYSYDIPSVLSAADLAIVSSSAMTLAEISAMGLPSILIPKAYTAENHQEYNARAYEEKGASKVILESELNGELLFTESMKILNDDALLKDMGERSKSIAKVDATKIIVDEIEKLVDRSKG